MKYQMGFPKINACAILQYQSLRCMINIRIVLLEM